MSQDYSMRAGYFEKNSAANSGILPAGMASCGREKSAAEEMCHKNSQNNLPTANESNLFFLEELHCTGEAPQGPRSYCHIFLYVEGMEPCSTHFDYRACMD